LPGGIARPFRGTAQRKQSGVNDGRQDASAQGARSPWRRARATCKSLEFLFHGGSNTDETGCSISRSLPGHAELATARCGAPGTT